MDADCLSGDELSAWVAGMLTAPARARAVAHVADCRDCREAVSALALVASAAELPVGAAAEPALPLAIAKTIGRFSVERVLGRGGMGVVVAAQDPELGRVVAIKVLPAATSPEAIAALEGRLVREGRALAGLRHPNVITVHEVGRDGDQLYLVMELIDGTSLRQWLLAAQPTWRAALAVCLAAGRGLAALHDAGLLHRDIKPDNILVGRDGRTLVADLGLAAPAERDPAVSHATRTGALVGTLRYLAPEVLSGEPASARSDQYAFAVTTLEALEVGGASAAPNPVRAILRRAIERDPAARFASMSALLDGVSRAMAAGRRRAALLGATGAAAIATTALLVVPHAHDAAIASTVGMTVDAAVPVVASDAQMIAADAARPSVVHEVSSPAPARAAREAMPAPAPARPSLADLGHPITTAAGERAMLATCSFATIEWGRITRRELLQVPAGETRAAVLLYELDGTRGRHVFDGASLTRGAGVLDVAVHGWAAVCLGSPHEAGWMTLPAGWTGPVWSVRGGYAPIAGPPAVTTREPQPRYVTTAAIRAGSLAAGTVVLTRAAPGPVLDRGRREMPGWILDVPAGIPGEDLLTGAAPRWIVATVTGVERTMEGDPPELRATTILRATEILDHLLD